MPLYDLKAFYRWLDEASLEELEARYKRLDLFILEHATSSILKEARYYKIAIEKEIFSRSI